MNLINFKLVTPEKTVLSEELASLTCPTTMGYITILPNHTPLVATLTAGELVAKHGNGKESFILVTGGFVQINQNSQVIILADSAEHHYEIDEQRAEAARQKAQTEIAEKKMSQEEYAQVSAALERSLARINVVRKRAHRKNPIAGSGVRENLE